MSLSKIIGIVVASAFAVSLAATVTISSRDDGLADSQWVKPRIFITNDGTESLQLFKLRYYFMVENGKAPQITMWDPSTLPALVVEDSTGLAYAEINFNGQTTLLPGASLLWGNGMQFGIHYADWSTFDKSNDWSQPTVGSGSSLNTHITLNDAFGNLVAGLTPPAFSSSIVTASSSSAIVVPVANQQIPDCWTRFAFLASLDLNVGDRSFAKGGSVRANRNALLGYDAKVDSSVQALGNITLRDRANVGKDLLAGGTVSLGNSTSVGGTTLQSDADLASCDMSIGSLSAGSGGSDVSVAPGLTDLLSAGMYGNVQVQAGGILSLDSGDYYVSSLTLSADSKIQLLPGTGRVRVWVSGAFDLGDRSQVVFAGDSLPLRLQIVSLGTSTVRIGYDAVLFGTFAAPLADFTYNTRASVVGAVIGRNVSIDADSKLQFVSRVASVNVPPEVTAGAVAAAFGSATVLGQSALQVIDVDTPNDQLVITVVIPPVHGSIQLDGTTLSAGGKFTMQAFLQGRVSYVHDGSVNLEDQTVIQVFDGLTSVPATILFHVQQPPSPDVHILYPYAGSQVDSSLTSVIWTVNGLAKADSESLVWGDNTIARSFTDYWGRIGSDQIVVHHPNRVKIIYPENNSTVDGYATTVRWQVDGSFQTYDTTENLAKGVNKIFRRAVRNGVLAGVDTITVTSLGIVPSPVVPQPAQTHQTLASHYVKALTQGENKVQKGIADSAIKDRRAAFVRGRVIGTDSLPLAGAVVRILEQPEVGYTVTGNDGQYVIVVNGGGAVTLDVEKKGYLALQRPSTVGWNKWAHLDDVVLTMLDIASTPVTFNSTSVQVAKSTGHSDADGYRETRTFVMPGTKASLVLADGSTLPMDKLTMRTTEFTVGSTGPKAMPAPVAVNTAYTFAAEFSVDEAGDAKTVQFSKPVPVYVDNYLGFPVGTGVPAGWYDRTKATWVAENDGLVIKILSVTAGKADLDINGDGVAETESALAAIGITADEQTSLASQYAVGKELWRMPLNHFTVWDFNPTNGVDSLAIGPPGDSLSVSGDSDTYDSVTTYGDTTDCQCDQLEEGSVIGVENGSIGEVIPIAGTPYSFNYNSMDSRGYGRTNSIIVRVKNRKTLPASLKRVEVDISYLGRDTKRIFYPPAIPDTMSFKWDGKDAFGNFVKGYADFSVSVTYVYPELRLGVPGSQTKSFAQLAASNSQVISHMINWETSAVYTYGKRLYVAPGFAGWNLQGMRPWDMSDSIGVVGADLSIRKYMGVNQSPIGSYSNLESGCYSLASSPDGSLDYSFFDENTRKSGYMKFGSEGTNAVEFYNNDTGNPVTDGDSALAPSGAVTVSYPVPVLANANNEMFFVNYFFQYGVDQPAEITKVGKDGLFHIIKIPCTTGSYDCEVKGMTMDASGNIFAVLGDEYAPMKIIRIDPDGGQQVIAVLPTTHNGDNYYSSEYRSISLDGNGGFFVASDHDVFRIDALGHLSTFIGGGNINIWDIPSRGTVLASSVNIDGFSVGNIYQTPSGAVIEYDSKLFLYSKGYLHHLAGAWGYATRFDGTTPVDAYNAELDNEIGTITPDGKIIEISGNYMVELVPTNPAMASLNDLSYQTGNDGKFYGYDVFHNLVRVVDPLSLKTIRKYGYDSAGNASSITEYGLSDSGRTTTLSLDTVAGLWNVTAPDGKTTRIRFNPASKMVDSITDPSGGKYAMRYDSLGLLVSFSNPVNRKDSIAYDSAGQLHYDGDAFGKGKRLVRTVAGDTARNVITTPEGRTRTYIKIRKPDGTVNRIDLSETGDSTFSRVDPTAGRSETRHSDGTREISYSKAMPQRFSGTLYPYLDSLILPSGTVQVTNRDIEENENEPWSHQLTDKVTVNGKTWTTTTDFIALQRTIASPLGRTRIQMLDSSMRVISDSIRGRHSVNYHYDLLGQVDLVSQAFDSNGVSKVASVAMTYGLAGNLLTVTDAYGHVSRHGYDSLDRVITLALPDTGVVGFHYDGVGNIIGLTPPNGNEHKFGYDDHDRDTSYQAPAISGVANADRQIYDRDELPTQRILPSGDTVKLQREASGRLTGVVIPDASYSTSYVGKSDKLLSMDRVATGSPTISSHLQYSYDGSRLTAETMSGTLSGSVGWTFNASGRVATTLVNGASTLNTYDSDGLLTKVGSLTLSRNSQRGNIDSTALGNVKSVQTLDSAGRLTTLRYMLNGTTIREWNYTYDALGRIVAMDDHEGSTLTAWVYNYDARGRLVTVSKNGVASNTYSYDLNGNRIAKNATQYSYDSQDRLITDDIHSYSFDANGSLASIAGSLHSSNYHYDAFGNLVSATLEDGTLVSYDMDARNRRIGKRINGSLVEGFIYKDQLKPIAWLDGSSNVKATFVYGDRGNVPSYMVMGGVNYRFVTDHLGSVRMVINAATSAVVQEMDYDEFGVVTRNTNPGFQPFGYAGGLYDTNTGFVRFGARDYDPSVGRWTAKDPIRFKGGINFYVYVNNSPINHNDPRGMDNVGCDLPLPIKIFTDNDPATLECCAAHDACYDKNGCNASSWTSSNGGAACAQCNSNVADCFATADLGKDDPNKPNYYCAAMHQYVSIPGDFDSVADAEKKCQSKPKTCPLKKK